MAETKTKDMEKGRNEEQALGRGDRENRGIRRWEQGSGSLATPFEFFNRMTEEMDRAFDWMWRDFGFPRRSWLPRTLLGSRAGGDVWAPRVEAFEKGDRFIVRAELPGVKKEDVQVELADDALTIRGERREEHEEEREGYYHSEREYGHFYRAIPLPEGAIGESAQASFRDGILEVTMQAAPSQAGRGRRLEITDASESDRKK